MNELMLKIPIKTLKVFLLALATLALLLYQRPLFLTVKNHLPGQILSSLSTAPTASAAEIYPEFTCPCCFQPLNKEEPCCEQMVSMINFIDQKIGEGLGKEDVMLAVVKEFGLDRLTKEETREQIKQILTEQASEGAPRIKITEDFKDLGEVSQASGEVTVDFELLNAGQSDLIINKIDTSCGCTSATVIYQNQEGPRFSMEGHGQENPSDWQIAIAPGESAILRVFYDPNVHGELRGPVTRTVTLSSNDPVEFSKKVEITLTQVP